MVLRTVLMLLMLCFFAAAVALLFEAALVLDAAWTTRLYARVAFASGACTTLFGSPTSRCFAAVPLLLLTALVLHAAGTPWLDARVTFA